MRNIYIALLIAVAAHNVNASNPESTCYGTAKNGRLVNGVQLPSEGKNYISYSSVARMLGRTYVHSKVHDVVVDAYKVLEIEQPGKVFKYAETGYEEGGRFKPHKTHQNGLSVDFMTPVMKNGKSVHLPTHPFNKFGYSIEFDKKGNYEDYKIDYDALSAHLVALHKSASKHKIAMWRVIFSPDLQSSLYKTKYASYIRKNMQLSTKRSWVRHDEHYHVDFIVKCKPI